MNGYNGYKYLKRLATLEEVIFSSALKNSDLLKFSQLSYVTSFGFCQV